MKPAAAMATLVGPVLAQDLGSLPECAKNCLAQFTRGDNIGDCGRFDAKCICGSDSFIGGIACCLSSVCSEADQQSAVDYAVSFCRTQSVTVPSAVRCLASTSTPASRPTPTANAGPDGQYATGAAIYGGLAAAVAFW
ncbi:hypothetical protein F4778DRAFT_341380 [Xylariomycetidae sp. FL2044]|nr:hypothetical protein F4778DRAFT_341380 [Xylariomycetidae sp. FL2044]